MALKFKINGEVRDESVFGVGGDVRLRWREEYVNITNNVGVTSGSVYVTSSTSATNTQWYDESSGIWRDI